MSVCRLKRKVPRSDPPPRAPGRRFELILGVKSDRVSVEAGAVQMRYVG